jgi:PAS domain-containing protein
MAHIHDPPASLSGRRGEFVDDAIEALIRRAMAKQPGERHASAAAFRYELNTVMDMLDMGRKRARASGAVRIDNLRDATLREVFERSRLPQALLTSAGTFAFANRAFGSLVGTGDTPLEGSSLADTSLASLVPGLMRALRSVHIDGKPTERHARVERQGQSPLELTLWLYPLPLTGQEIHLFVRVEDVASPGDEER